MGATLARAAIAALIVAAGAWYGFFRPGEEARACGPAGPYDFDAYEPELYQSAYARAIELATAGKAITGVLTLANGESVDVRYQGVVRGPRGARTTVADPGIPVPPTIFKSIAWIESNWATGANAVPYGGVGHALRSFDCGYGISQITSGMGNAQGTPSSKQALIGTHYLFNIAEGVRILADKWNAAPKFRPIAGTGDPAALEDWYFAIWGYNGFAFSNHPMNPNRNPLRGEVYHCEDRAAPNHAGFLYGDFTYPERVYGCMRYPAVRNGERLWTAQTFEMPKFANETVASAFKPEAFQACDDANWAGGCPAMDFPTTIPGPIPDKNVVTHTDTTVPPNPVEAAAFLGDPKFSFTGPKTLALSAYDDGTASSGTITIENAGRGVGPYRIRTSAPWIVARHPQDPAGRSLDAGVVVGRDTEVVIIAPNATRKRVAQAGYQAVLNITLDPAKMPPGQSTGRLWIEPLLGSGGVFEVQVTGMKAGNSLKFRAVVPQLAGD